jgi:tripartite-type tricarboxylate transporter receptor subunit TctC
MLRRRPLALTGLALLAAPRIARAQAGWPDRPVRVMVPFTPGGTTDILARAMAAELQEALGQPFIVENRGGAGGTLGSEMVARAAPDGYTIMMGHIGTLAVNPSLYRNLTFDTVTSFQPIVLVAVVPNILVVNPRKVAAQNVQELIALARRQPRGLTYGSGGNGSAAHIAAVAFSHATGIEMEHVPYRGTGPMMTDLIAGTIDLTMTGGPPALPPVRSGHLRALGVSALQRMSSAPDIPTIAEQGVPGFDATQWYGLVAPAGTPRPIVRRLSDEILAALANPEVAARLDKMGTQVTPASAEDFDALIRSETERWTRVIRERNIRSES